MINAIADEFIARHEGCKLVAYQDDGGTWTCGWGSTGHDIHSGTIWTADYAAERRQQDVARFQTAVEALVKVPIDNNQQAALIDFAYNEGAHALAGSILLRKLNAGDPAGAVADFSHWDVGGGRVIEGLLNRRIDERNLFLLGNGPGVI